MKGIYEVRQGALETLFFAWRTRVHVHVRVHWRSTS